MPSFGRASSSFFILFCSKFAGSYSKDSAIVGRVVKRTRNAKSLAKKASDLTDKTRALLDLNRRVSSSKKGTKAGSQSKARFDPWGVSCYLASVVKIIVRFVRPTVLSRL